MKAIKFFVNIFLTLTFGLSVFWAIGFALVLLATFIYPIAVSAQLLIFLRLGLGIMFLLCLIGADHQPSAGNETVHTAPAPED